MECLRIPVQVLLLQRGRGFNDSKISNCGIIKSHMDIIHV